MEQAVNWIMRTYDVKGGRTNRLNREEFGKALAEVERARARSFETTPRLTEQECEYVVTNLNILHVCENAIHGAQEWKAVPCRNFFKRAYKRLKSLSP